MSFIRNLEELGEARLLAFEGQQIIMHSIRASIKKLIKKIRKIFHHPKHTTHRVEPTFKR